MRFLFPSLLVLALVPAVPPVEAQSPPPISDLAFLPGNSAVGNAPEEQNRPAIAAGGPGYLVVWQDKRTVLSGFTNMPSNPLGGNGWDILGARLDGDGNLLDASPILITQEGHNQEDPRVAWNGENWLVVWMRERDEWYFDRDLVGVRVSPAGTVLDPAPIPIRLDAAANWSASAPAVASDGTNWLVVWEDLVDVGDLPYPTLAATRLSPLGIPLDTPPVILQQHDVSAFGPRAPRAVFAGDEYLVAWTEAASDEVRFRRFTASLQPIDAQPIHVAYAVGALRLATDGAVFLLVTPARRAYRISHAGQVLDPGGISVDAGRDWQPTGPDVAWNGSDWIVVFSSVPEGDPFPGDPDLFLARIDGDGNVVDPPAPRLGSDAADDYRPAIASAGGGRVEIAWAPRPSDPGVAEDVRAANLGEIGLPALEAEASLGLTRQAFADFATAGDQHVAVYLSQGDGASRVLAQRLAADGAPLDAEPVELARYPERVRVAPHIAFDGARYLVVWAQAQTVWGRRLAVDGTPIDAAPVALLDDAAIESAVGGSNGNFLVAYTHVFSGDQQVVRVLRFAGSNLAPLDAASTLDYDFSSRPGIVTIGGRWLVAWQWQPSHDLFIPSVHAAFVEEGGAAGAMFPVSQSGYGADPGLAVAADRALVVWYDDANYNEAAIEGRLVAADGTFVGTEFEIADPPNNQFYPAAGWDGSNFLAAWVDYRSLPGIEQLRGDVWAMRIGPDGTLLDPPGGFQLTSGPLPEDLPAVAGMDGKLVVAFSKLHGAAGPEVQRLGYRVVGVAGSGLFADGFESGDTGNWSQTVPLTASGWAPDRPAPGRRAEPSNLVARGAR